MCTNTSRKVLNSIIKQYTELWIHVVSHFTDFQSHAQSPQVSWSASGRRERLWGNGIVTAGILRLMVLSFVTVNSPGTASEKNQFFFHYDRVSPRRPPADQEAWLTLGNKIADLFVNILLQFIFCLLSSIIGEFWTGLFGPFREISYICFITSAFRHNDTSSCKIM